MLSDADVPAVWQGLGLPGLADVHVHFLPERMLAKVWAYFDQAETHYGRAWPIRYRMPEPDRIAALQRLGVHRFPTLCYPHKAGMAAWLNQWCADFAAEHPEAIQSGTFFAEPSAADDVLWALDQGAAIFKVHVQVGGFDPSDPVLDEAWGLLAEAGVPVITHCGSGPIPGAHTGPGPIGLVLQRHPRLRLVIAHAGAPEYGQHLELALAYPNVMLDTTMVGTAYLGQFAPIPADVRARYADAGDRIVLGSDFPNIPYAYAEQIQSLIDWGFGDDWLKSVLWHNGARLLGL